MAIDVWTIRVTADSRVLSLCERTLSLDERERLHRLRRVQDRYLYATAHGALRHLLGQQLGIDPREVAFQSHPRGKPYIPRTDIQFSLSHSGDYAMIGIARQTQLGVDIQVVDPALDVDGIVQRYFHTDEMGALHRSREQRFQLFFEFWARKEAYAKAIGQGLYLKFSDFSVVRSPCMGEWILQDLSVDSRYTAALAYRGPQQAVIQHPRIDLDTFCSHFA